MVDSVLACPAPPQEWPQVHEASVSYLAPTLRPLDLPSHKPPRASLLNRIIRRLKNYWSPPVEGDTAMQELVVYGLVCVDVLGSSWSVHAVYP